MNIKPIITILAAIALPLLLSAFEAGEEVLLPPTTPIDMTQSETSTSDACWHEN